jgi:DNA-binding MarR family transcriptional regulator
LERELAPFKVTSAQWAILEMCYTGEANTVSGLARVIPVDAAAISRQLDKLRAKGLIRRRRLPRDRRTVRVELTEAGRALVPMLVPCVHANNAKFLEGISEEEQTALTSVIQKMLMNAEAAVCSDEELNDE